MVVLGIFLLGYISFKKLGIDLFPDLNNPRIFIELKAGERPPEEIEYQFVRNIESIAIRQKKVIQVSSISKVGSAQITVEYQNDADMDEAFLDLQKALTGYSQNSNIDLLNITQHNPNEEPVMIVGMYNPDIDDMDDLRKIAENYIRNELIRLEGIAEVEISGKEEKEVVIRTDPYLLRAYGISPETITNRIQSINRNISGGTIVEMGTQYIIKGIGEFQSLDDIKNLIIDYRSQQNYQEISLQDSSAQRVPIFLKDVAEVNLSNKEPINIVRVNGKRCLGLSIYKETKFNTINAVNQLKKVLESIKKALPGYEFTIIQNQGDFIQKAVNEVKETGLIGVILAVVILYVFLRRIGTTAIISLAIPMSIVATFNLMYFTGLTINIMTLGGLALGAGMLVDNAIVVMENIFRNIESGLSIREASVTGTAQVGGAITASTITTIVVFLPIVYIHHAAGELFKDQALTVAFSLLSSLIVAILVIPMLTSKFLRKNVSTVGKSIRFEWYKKFLERVLKIKWYVIAAAAALIATGVLLFPIVGSEFIPYIDSGQFSVELILPEGTELRRTEQVVDNVENLFRRAIGKDLETLYARIGPSESFGSTENSILEGENSALIKIVLRPDREKSSEEIIENLSTIAQNIPDLEVKFIQDQTALQTVTGTESAPVVVEVKGKELSVIEELTEQVKNKMIEIKELFNIETSFEEGAPEIEVVVDRMRAGVYNITVNQITSQLRDRLMGKSAGQWESEGELKDITIRLPDVSIDQLRDIELTSGNRKILLDDVASIRITRAPKKILRRNQTRIGQVSAHIQSSRPFNHIIHEIESKLGSIDFPPDYRYEITGAEQKRKVAMRNLGFALILSVILVYMVLASTFESLVHPFTIILTIPLAVVGAILMFFIIGKPLNIIAVIGIIMLVGIAVNDSIILVDAITRLREKGISIEEAITEAGQRRIRPIIMTSLTTILALLPLTLGFGEGAALRAPMALAVIGGLVTSTLLTLLVIPCVYNVLEIARTSIRKK